MKWLKVSQENDTIQSPLWEPHPTRRVERLPLADVISEMTLLGQFFVAPGVLADTSSTVQVPMFETADRDVVMTEIAPHFTSAKIMHFQGDKAVGILTGVRPSSRDLFLTLRQEDALHPIVTDLFRGDKHSGQRERFNTVIYEINKEMIEVSTPQGFEEFWHFINKTFVKKESHFTISPHGWELDQHLTQSLYLRALNAVCNKIRLYVDSQSNRVLGISAEI